MNAPRLLVVCPRAFASGWGADTPRLLQMTRGLKRHGWEVHLLRCKNPNEAQLVPVIGAFPGRVHTAPFFGPYPGLFNRKGLRRVMRLWLRSHGQGIINDYPELTRARFIKFATARRVPQPNVVFAYTTGQLESFVSAESLSRQMNCPLALEYRDPLPHPGSKPLDAKQKMMLERCLGRASLVISTTESLRESLAREFPVTLHKSRTIYSCYDDESPVPAQKGPSLESLILVHAGALHGGERRNARSLVKAIAEAATQEPALRGKVTLRLIGAAKGGQEAMELANQLEIPWAVEVLPQMSHQDCLAQMEAGHVLVVIKFDDPAYDLQIPGKTFQYLGRGKPILGLMRETEAAGILRQSGLGVVVGHGEISKAAEAVRELWQARRRLQDKYRPDWGYIRQFSLTSMAERFHCELSAAGPTNLAMECPAHSFGA